MQNKLIVGNWKENPENLELAQKLLEISSNFPLLNITHAVPSIFVGFLMSTNKNSKIILENISCYEGGSHTGEISANQAKSLGISESIVGHSETRLSPQNPRGDEDVQINLKLKNLLTNNMSAILCVGEFERKEEDESYKKFIVEEIENCLKNIDVIDFDKLIIAYEPIWAIGKNALRVATNKEIIETITFIKNFLTEKGFPNCKILYGGSVDENNAKEILEIECVDGLLIGRASSDPIKWQKLLENISK